MKDQLSKLEEAIKTIEAITKDIPKGSYRLNFAWHYLTEGAEHLVRGADYLKKHVDEATERGE